MASKIKNYLNLPVHHVHKDDSGEFVCPLGSKCDLQDFEWERERGYSFSKEAESINSAGCL